MRIYKKIKLPTSDQALYILMIALFVKDILQMILNYWFGSFLGKVIIYGIIAILIILAWSVLYKTITAKDIAALCIWSALLLLNVLFLEKEKGSYLKLVIEAFVNCYPMYFFGKALGRVKEDIQKYLKICPIIASIAYLGLTTIAGSGMYGEVMYSQSIGYALVASASIAVFYSLEGVLYLIPTVVILIYGVLMSGARGPLVCMCLTSILMVIRKLGKKSIRNIVIITLLSVIMILVIGNYENFLQILILFADENGYSTRTLQTLLSGSFLQSKGRFALFDAALKGIQKTPITGMGIFHDRQYLIQYATLADRRGSNGKTVGLYPHNIFLEWLLQYGVLIGCVLVIFFIVILIFNFKECQKDNSNYLLLTSLLAIGFFPLLISGSYISWEHFYLLMGFMIANLKVKKFE